MCGTNLLTYCSWPTCKTCHNVVHIVFSFSLYAGAFMGVQNTPK